MCRVKFPKRQNSIETQALLLQSFLGKYDKPPTCKVSHWPFIPTGSLVNFSVTFTLCRLVSIEHGGVIIFSCFSCFFLFFFYIKNDIVNTGREERLMKFQGFQTEVNQRKSFSEVGKGVVDAQQIQLILYYFLYYTRLFLPLSY